VTSAVLEVVAVEVAVEVAEVAVEVVEVLEA
jgi:hypothetical protein